MKRTGTVKTAIKLPIIGISAAWLLFIIGNYLEALAPSGTYTTKGDYLYPDPRFSIEVYFYFAGITVFAMLALAGQKRALSIRTEQDSPLAISAHRLNNLGVVLALVAGAIFAIGNFLGAWNTYEPSSEPLGLRLLNVYLPIVLATALVVFVILSAFVFRKDAPDLPAGQGDEERARLQKAVGLAYASPIIGTAIAIIFGLTVYDITNTTLDVWIWVIIQAVIAVSIIIGTRFAAQARSSKPLPVKPRRTGLAATNLNLVLAIVFGVVVYIMAFTMGFSAISNLEVWPEWRENMTPMEQQPTMLAPNLLWFVEDMLPALVLLLLADFGIYRTTLTRNSNKDQIAK